MFCFYLFANYDYGFSQKLLFDNLAFFLGLSDISSTNSNDYFEFFLYHLPRFKLIVNINNLNIYFIFSLRSGCTTQWREPRMSTMEERISIALKNSSSLESSRPNSNPRKSHFNYNLHTFSVSDSKKLFLDFSFIKIYARVIIFYIYIYNIYSIKLAF